MRRRLLVFRRPDSLNVWVMGVSVLLAVLGQAIIELIVHILGGRTASSVTWLTGAVLLVLVVTVGMLNNIYSRTDELANRLGLSIEYYRLDPGPTHSSIRDQQAQDLYGACIRLIDSVSEGASSKIIAVNSFVEIGSQPGDKHVEEASRRYLATLDSKIGRIPYHRVVQLSERESDLLPNGSIGDLIAPNYCDHYQRIVSARLNSHGQQLATLEAVRAKYPISFVVLHDSTDSVYGGRLIWQMHEHVYDSGNDATFVQLTGVFIVRDPEGIIVKTFMEWYDELDRSEHRWILTSHNLVRSAESPGAAINPELHARRLAGRPWRRSGDVGNETGQSHT
jgi:hypothetical protein